VWNIGEDRSGQCKGSMASRRYEWSISYPPSMAGCVPDRTEASTTQRPCALPSEARRNGAPRGSLRTPQPRCGRRWAMLSCRRCGFKRGERRTPHSQGSPRRLAVFELLNEMSSVKTAASVAVPDCCEILLSFESCSLGSCSTGSGLY
jgi:hypothetical protein